MTEPEGKPFRFSLPKAPEGRYVAGEYLERELQRQIDELPRSSSEHAFARVQMMMLYGRSGRLDRALEVLETLLADEADGDDKARWTLTAGILVEGVGDFAAAAALYRRALAFGPGDEEVAYFVHNNLAFSLNQTGEFAEGEAQARAAIALDPERHNAHKNLGVALENGGRIEEAARSYVAAVHAEASDSRALTHLESMVQAHPRLLELDPGLEEEIARCRQAVATALAARLDGQQN